MLTEERKNLILKLLHKEKIVKNNDLAKQLNTSISTIRRDLQELEDEQKLIRIHGGAKLFEPVTAEQTMNEKTTKNTQEKTTIAKFAAKQIPNNSTIYLDAGSTTFTMIPYLADKNLIVVTNSISHAKALSEAKISTYILGGFIKNTTQAVIQTTALKQLEDLHFDLAFLGTNAICPNEGLMTPDIEEASIKQIAIKQSQKTYILADHSKFEHLAFKSFAKLEQVTLLTDYIPKKCRSLYKEKTTIKELNL